MRGLQKEAVASGARGSRCWPPSKKRCGTNESFGTQKLHCSGVSFSQRHDAELTAAIRLARAQLAMSRSRFDAARIDARAMAAVSLVGRLALAAVKEAGCAPKRSRHESFWKLGENACANLIQNC